MPYYKYKVINKNFEKENGVIEAADQKQVERVLVGKGYQIISVTVSLSDQIFKHYFNKIFNKIKAKDLVLFFRQFSVLIQTKIKKSRITGGKNPNKASNFALG